MKVYKEYEAVQFDGTKESIEDVVVGKLTSCNGDYVLETPKMIYGLKKGQWLLKDTNSDRIIIQDSIDDCKKPSDIRGRRPRPSEEATNFVELCSLNREKIYRLLELGVLTDGKDNVRDHNVGKSNYATHSIQSWSVWKDWNLNPWDADIVKRIERTKEGEEPTERYEKIIHIAKERLRQIRLGKYKIDLDPKFSGENIKRALENMQEREKDESES